MYTGLLHLDDDILSQGKIDFAAIITLTLTTISRILPGSKLFQWHISNANPSELEQFAPFLIDNAIKIKAKTCDCLGKYAILLNGNYSHAHRNIRNNATLIMR